MKKFLKNCSFILVAVFVAFSFCGCKTKISATSVDTQNVAKISGVSTNGGMTVVNDGYLYFINGTKENDGTVKKNNKRSAIARIKYDVATGATSGDAEIVISDFVGYDNGSINIFGDFLYYTTPCADENYKGEVLYNKVCFKRYDLVNKKSYTLYTTNQNDSSEKVKFAYYVVGDELNLVVYENKNKTITSLKIDSKVKTNYVITGVKDCLLSENYGTVTASGATVDANSFVFYTKSPDKYDSPNTGVKVFKTEPNKFSGEENKLSEGKDITLLSIRCGMLLFAYNENVYAQSITAGEDDKLNTDNPNCIAHKNFENAIFLENYQLTGKDETAKLVKAEGHISVLYFSDKAFCVCEFDGTLNSTQITTISSASSFSFVGLTTLEEDDPDNEGEKINVLYAVYTESSLVYKLEIARVLDENNLQVTQFSEPIKLSTTKISSISGLLVPEIAGNYLFMLSENDDKIEYMFKVDLTATKNVEEAATKIAIED